MVRLLVRRGEVNLYGNSDCYTIVANKSKCWSWKEEGREGGRGREDEEVSAAFKKNKISGSVFLRLSEGQLGRMVEAIGDVVELQALLKRASLIIIM